MTTFLTIAGLFIFGGMALTLGIVRMADKPMPKPPLRLVSTDELADLVQHVSRVAPGPYESRTVHGYHIPPTTDERGAW